MGLFLQQQNVIIWWLKGLRLRWVAVMLLVVMTVWRHNINILEYGHYYDMPFWNHVKNYTGIIVKDLIWLIFDFLKLINHNFLMKGL